MESVVADDRRFYRHRLWVRVTHWINVICMTGLLMSGLQIFNAHPALYWGNAAAFDSPFFAIGTVQDAQGRSEGITTIAGHAFNTSGVLGLSGDPRDPQSARGFPDWATIPSTQWLAMGRRWHFFFAWLFVLNGAVYGLYALASRHFWRALLPSRADWRGIGHSVIDHLRLRFPRGAAAMRYNVLQKLSYLVVICGLGPVMVLAGLALSPRLDAGLPWLLVIFGGRQSARTIHFLCAFALLAFTLVHVAMVVASGPLRNLRSMITGWYDLGEDHHEG